MHLIKPRGLNGQGKIMDQPLAVRSDYARIVSHVVAEIQAIEGR
jgi:hypothetical protein